jgi:hypothetical protein
MTSTEETQNKKRGPLGKIAVVLLPLLLFSYLYGIASNLQLNDPDLFWHIKTGDFITNNWEVPEVDPFAYTTPRPLSLSQKIGLRSQWLGQVVFYLAYEAGGLRGVHIFRNFLIILPPLLLYVWMIRRGSGILSALIVTSFSAFVYAIQLFYSFERPQGISFLMILILIMLMERFRAKSEQGIRDYTLWLIPILMGLWSNMHAGFIIGNLVIGIYFLDEAIRTVYHKTRKTGVKTVRPLFFIVCIAAFLATFLNPNTYKLFYSYTSGMFSMFVSDTQRAFTGHSGSWVQDVVLEFKPLYYFYINLNYKWLVFYWAFTVLLFLSMFVKYWLKRRLDLAELLTVSLIVFFANYHARGLMFSLSIMPFYMAKTIMEIRMPELKFKVLSKGILAFMLLFSVGFCTYTYKQTPRMFRPGIVPALISPWYPIQLVSFLKANRIAPPMYNYYTWGGYLIWSIYPEYQVFIDGRAIDNIVNRTADDILKTQRGWASKLDAYGINFVVIPVAFRESGHIVPLGPALAENNKWKLIFLRNNSAIFVRDVPKNKDLIFKFNIDKKKVYWEIVSVENLFLSAQPYNPVFNIAKADALFALGKYKEAKAILKKFPKEGKFRLMRLKDMGY